jgi:D-xylose transport system substrate-binding protein
MAVTKVQGRDIAFDALTRDRVDSPTQQNVPALLVPVVSLTKDTIKKTVIADGVYTVRQICTAAHAAGCAAVGLK